jgi:hypothetical protein
MSDCDTTDSWLRPSSAGRHTTIRWLAAGWRLWPAGAAGGARGDPELVPPAAAVAAAAAAEMRGEAAAVDREKPGTTPLPQLVREDPAGGARGRKQVLPMGKRGAVHNSVTTCSSRRYCHMMA